MVNSTSEFHLCFNRPDQNTVHTVNAVLAAQKYSKLKISHVKSVIVKETYYKPDGTVNYERENAGISDISFSGEMEEHHSGYDYRLHITLLPHEFDRGIERFREKWSKLHLYSTVRQLIQHKFKQGVVYIVLYHDGHSNEAEIETMQSDDTGSNYENIDSDAKYTSARMSNGLKKYLHIEDDDWDE